MEWSSVLSAGSGATAGAISVGTNAARTSEVTIGSATIPVTLQANPVTVGVLFVRFLPSFSCGAHGRGNFSFPCHPCLARVEQFAQNTRDSQQFPIFFFFSFSLSM